MTTGVVAANRLASANSARALIKRIGFQGNSEKRAKDFMGCAEPAHAQWTCQPGTLARKTMARTLKKCRTCRIIPGIVTNGTEKAIKQTSFFAVRVRRGLHKNF